MNIYEIDAEILACCDLETGEIIDSKKLDALQMERKAKIDNLACWYKQLNAEAEAIKAEEITLTERRKQKEEQAARLKNYLSEILAGQKLETARNKISWRKSECIIFTNEEAIPDIFKEEIVTVKISKDAIKAAIKNGAVVNGVEIVENNNIQIK